MSFPCSSTRECVADIDSVGDMMHLSPYLTKGQHR
jgi:hypothetical protein